MKTDSQLPLALTDADDPAIAEIRATRHAISESCHHETGEFIAYYMAMQKDYASRLHQTETIPLESGGKLATLS